jgi:hypothetical protein
LTSSVAQIARIFLSDSKNWPIVRPFRIFATQRTRFRVKVGSQWLRLGAVSREGASLTLLTYVTYLGVRDHTIFAAMLLNLSGIFGGRYVATRFAPRLFLFRSFIAHSCASR